MSRRSACSVASVAIVVLLGLLFAIPVNYSVLSPGPACNTVGLGTAACPSEMTGNRYAPLISVPAAYDHPSTSHLSLLTVSEANYRPSAAWALINYFRSGYAVLPRELVHPPGKSEKQVQQQNVQDMVQAQNSAVVAAELQLGLDRAQVRSVDPTGPSAFTLEVGDQLLSVDGKAVDSAEAFVAATASRSSKTTYTVVVQRGTARMSVTLRKAQPVQPTSSPQPPLFGIGLQDLPTIPVTISLDANAIGGPSAGLMFALGVYDRLTPGDLSGTLIVAGTGTIGAGNDPLAVGAIGGIQQKLYAARHDVHATLFLAPVSNCSDTRGAIPNGLRVVPVSTFGQALEVLAEVREGRTADLPHC